MSMDKLKVTIEFAENMAMCIKFPGKKIWIDINPHIDTPSFSYVKNDQWNIIKTDPKWAPPTEVFFTHLHADHYSDYRTEEISELFPEVPIISPFGFCFGGGKKYQQETEEIPGIRIHGYDDYVYESEGLKATFIRTVHSSKYFIDAPHRSILLEYGGKSVFISGDAHVTEPMLVDRLENMHVDLAIVNFPWITMEKTRSVLENYMAPSHVLLVHIPGPDHDFDGYRALTAGCTAYLKTPDVKSALTPMSTFEFML